MHSRPHIRKAAKPFGLQAIKLTKAARTDNPYSNLVATVRVKYKYGGATNLGTAFRIGPRTWLTSAHTLRDYANELIAEKVWITPGPEYLGGNPGDRAVKAQVHEGWSKHEPINADIALLVEYGKVLSPNPILTLKSPASAPRKNAKVLLVGYHNVNNRLVGPKPSFEHILETETDRLRYPWVTRPGHSGGPVILWPPSSSLKGRLSVIGVHSRGEDHPDSKPGQSMGTRLTDDLIAWINKHIQ